MITEPLAKVLISSIGENLSFQSNGLTVGQKLYIDLIDKGYRAIALPDYVMSDPNPVSAGWRCIVHAVIVANNYGLSKLARRFSVTVSALTQARDQVLKNSPPSVRVALSKIEGRIAAT